jgi:hypothetical protein
VAYDPQTGLNWAFASFTYSGPATTAGNSPSVAMQDGGDTGYFYRIPITGGVPSADDGWVMLGSQGVPPCYSRSIVPSSVIHLWGLVDSTGCAAPG